MPTLCHRLVTTRRPNAAAMPQSCLLEWLSNVNGDDTLLSASCPAVYLRHGIVSARPSSASSPPPTAPSPSDPMGCISFCLRPSPRFSRSRSSVDGGACHCVRRRVWPKANAEREESVFQQAAAQGTQCEARSRSLPGRRTRCDVGRRFALRALGGGMLENRLAMRGARSSQYASPHPDGTSVAASHCVP